MLEGKRRKPSQPPSIKSEWMGRSRSGRYSNANMRFQSFFMLMTVQPSLSRCGCRRRHFERATAADRAHNK